MSSAEITAGLLETLTGLAAQFTPHLERAEREARLPDEIALPLLRAGFFRLWIPVANGGLELSLPDALRLYSAAAEIDGSLGWAIMIGAGGGLFAAWLPPGGAQELFGLPQALVAGSGTPSGTAERVAGGYRVQGRWRFASGAHHASVFTAACRVTEAGQDVRDAQGRPLVRAMSIRPADVRILETWDPTGLRATGSHDFCVGDAWVPEHHSFSVLTDPPRETGALYRLPFMLLTELPVSAVGIGIARHALSEFARRTPPHKISDSLVQMRFAQAHAALEMAQAVITALAQEAWDGACRGHAPSDLQLARISASCCTSQEQLREAVARLSAVAGMAALEPQQAFTRASRDLQALGVHGSLAPTRLVPAGDTLLQAGRSDTTSSARLDSGGPHTLPEHT